MTLGEFKAVLLEADPKAKRYSTKERGNFTVWREYERLYAFADGQNQGGWKVQIDRYTTEENDAVAEAILTALDAQDCIAYQHLVDYDAETEIIRHIFDCEVG